MIGTITGLLSGVCCTALYSLQTAEVTSMSLTWYQYLIISIVPTIIGLIGDIIVAVLKNKGAISAEDADKISERLEEMTEKLEEDIDKLEVSNEETEDKSNKEE